MSISERLQMVIKMNGMTNASFADEIGVQRSSISHVLAGRNKPSIDFIQKILIAFPKVNADWLVTGKKIGRTVETIEDKADDVSENIFKPVTSSLDTDKSKLEGDREEYIKNTAHKSGSEMASHATIKKQERRISRIIVFYDDGTFEETIPS